MKAALWLGLSLMGFGGTAYAAPEDFYAEDPALAELLGVDQMSPGELAELNATSESDKWIDADSDDEYEWLLGDPARGTDYCSRTLAGIHQVAMSDQSWRMGYANWGGIANGGVCWWHSRMQRSAFYLAAFDPGAPRPDSQQVEAIIRALVRMKRPVVIGGYANFYDFTRDHYKVVQKYLDKWQMSDAIWHFAWVRGLSGSTNVSARKLERMMKDLNEKYLESGDILFQMLQIPGIDAHAWLVTDVRPSSQGFDLSIIDSNRPHDTLGYEYKQGMRNFSYGGRPFVPYSAYSRDLTKMHRAFEKECGKALPRA